MKHNLKWLIIVVILFPIIPLLYLLFFEHKTEFFFNITNILYSGITITVLAWTLYIYERLLKVSEQTLSFTKTQTSYNFYFDNYKLFYELSKLKTDNVYDQEVLDKPFKLFDNLTFAEIHFNYVNILDEFPRQQPAKIKYELVFNRFNFKIQSFIDVLLDEITKIKNDNNLLLNQRVSLINLYKSFIMRDYINLCNDLIKNRDYNKNNTFDSILSTNYLRCNSEGRTIFDMDNFLKLYNEIEII